MDTSYLSLTGKVALVTGGSRGIGKAIALQFADAGADVIVSSRKLADLEKVAEEIRGMGRRGLAVSAHNAKMDELRNLVEKVKEEFGRIDVLVNNAATNPIMCSVLDMDEPPFDIIMNVNIKGYFFLSQAAAKMMAKQGGGVIINVASVGGISPDPGLAAYCMSKAAIIMMTKAMALELGHDNIRVNAIAPGIVKTRFSQALWSNPDILNPELEKMPLRRISEPEEIARTALYLASDASNFMTGHTVVLDGGANL